MCHVLVFVFIVLARPSESFPQISSGNTSRFYEPVAKDLQKLSIWFQNCHVHVILRGNDVPLNSIQNPYILTLPRRLRESSIYDRCARGRFAIPASTKMVSPCQATIYINLFQVSAMADTIELVMAEECTKVYKLKERHSIILALYEKFEFKYASHDRSAGHPGGGNTLLVLLYAFTSSGSPGFLVIQAGLLICAHCVYLHYNIVCSSVETCLGTSEVTHRQTTQAGKAITWGFLPSEARPVDPSTGNFYPFLHCLYPRQQRDRDCATFPKLAMLNYVVGGLNSSFITQGRRRFGVSNLRSPTRLVGGWGLYGKIHCKHCHSADPSLPHEE